VFSRLLFSFVGSLMARGQHLEPCDLWDTSRQDEPAALWTTFQQHLAATATHSAHKVHTQTQTQTKTQTPASMWHCTTDRVCAVCCWL